MAQARRMKQCPLYLIINLKPCGYIIMLKLMNKVNCKRFQSQNMDSYNKQSCSLMDSLFINNVVLQLILLMQAGNYIICGVKHIESCASYWIELQLKTFSNVLFQLIRLMHAGTYIMVDISNLVSLIDMNCNWKLLSEFLKLKMELFS